MMSLKSKALWHPKKAFIFILPSALLFLFFFLYPIIYSVSLSFTNASFFNLIKGYDFIGFKNFVRLLINGDFYQPLFRTLLFMVTSVGLKVIAGLFLAALFTSPYFLFKNFYYPLYLIPWAMPWFLIAMIWRGMFNQDFGIINQILVALNMQPVNWLNNTWNAFFSFNIVEVYLVYPFMMTVILAAVRSIPKEVKEAAVMDGASFFDQFRYIIIPLIKRPFLWATLMTTIASYMIFGVPYLLNRGGPAGTNEFLLIFGYKGAFEAGRYGYASAFMVIVFVILIIFVLAFSRLTRLTRTED